jgi:MraZ protein
VFLGEYQHSLDAKGRIILPSRFRARLAEGCVLTRGQEDCLAVYAKEEFDELAARLRQTKQSSTRRRNFLRLFFSGAHEEVPDKQGRVTIPEHLRSYATLERDVTVIGTGSKLEIWDRAKWDEQLERTEREFRDLDMEDPDLDY